MKWAGCVLVVMILITSFLTASENVQGKEKTETYEGLVNVNGVNIFCKFDGGENPVVVLDSAYGKDHLWTNVLAEELRETDEISVFQYDRPGLGQSDISKLERTPVNKAIELHSLLEARGIDSFYYVGSALGGLTIREYVYLYPNEVKGIVMMDCINEWQIEGIEDFLNSVDDSLLSKFISEFGKEDGTYDDLKNGINQIKKIKKFDSLRNIPLVVMSGNYHGFGDILDIYQNNFAGGENMENKWMEWQNNVAKLSDYSIKVDVDVYSYFIKKTETRYILNLIGVETEENNFIDQNLFFSERPYGVNLPLFRFFGLKSDGLGW